MGLFRREISSQEMKTVKRLLRECQDLSQKLNTCAQPRTFFDTYDALEARLRELAEFEKYRVFGGNTPSRDLRRLQDGEQNEINAMIQRSFVRVRDGSEKLDPEERRRALAGYFEGMEPWLSRMSRFNRKVVRDLRTIALGKA